MGRQKLSWGIISLDSYKSDDIGLIINNLGRVWKSLERSGEAGPEQAGLTLMVGRLGELFEMGFNSLIVESALAETADRATEERSMNGEDKAVNV